MKLHELAKNLNMKSHDLLNLAKEKNFDIKGISQVLSDHEVKSLTDIVNGNDKEVDALNTGRFIGVYYNPNTKMYETCTVEIHRNDFEKLNVQRGLPKNTIFKIKNDLSVVMAKVGFLEIAPLEKLFERRRKLNGEV